METGRKIYPGANPNVLTYMVAVFDNFSGLNGFIDPNSTAFTPQNTDRPYYFATGGSNMVDPTSDLAPPVYTRGNIFGSSNLDISGSARIYGKLYLPSIIVGTANMSPGVLGGGYKRLTVTTSGCTASSKIFLSNSTLTDPGTAYSTESVVSGSFVITSNNTSDTSLVNWLIIN